jgi:hypothetical protein
MNEVSAARPRRRHELKEWPEFFAHTMAGRKKFQLRKNDRDGFQVGDELMVKEWDPKGEYGSPSEKTEPVGFTGRAVLLRVDYIMGPAIFGTEIPLDPEYVIMSTSIVA